MATTKKTVVKSKKAPATKKTTTKSVSKKIPLTTAQGEQCFWCSNGEVLSSLVELQDALKAMEEEVFAHHVNKERNDFANWIEYVLGDAELASAFKKAQKPHTARIAVVRRLRVYDI